MASLGAIFAELATVDAAAPDYGLYVALAIATVVLSWAFTHTIFALHYAHEFYGRASAGTVCEFPDDGAAGLLGLHLFLLRHRHDIPGVGRGRSPTNRSGGWSSRTARCRFSSPPPSWR